MKKFILSILAFGGLFTACDNIDEGDRWTKPEIVDVQKDTEAPEIQKNILIEDFTGQDCVNCPSAADVIKKISESPIGERVVAVGIHGGGLTRDYKIDKRAVGLTTVMGDDYNTYWNVETWPAGMIDRTDGNGNVGKTCAFETWETAIAKRLTEKPTVDLKLATDYDEATRALKVDVTPTAKAGTTMPGGCKVTVWLTESGLVRPQKRFDEKNATILDKNYVHNHVLRESLTDPYGDAVKGTDAMTYSHTIPMTYGKATAAEYTVLPENMAVVAFITDKSGEVLQVVEGHVVK